MQKMDGTVDVRWSSILAFRILLRLIATSEPDLVDGKGVLGGWGWGWGS